MLLLVASASLIIPFERLRPGMRATHPANDRANHPDAATRLDRLLNKGFRSSPLWGDEIGSWEHNQLVVTAGGPDAWVELRSSSPLADTFNVQQLLGVIRNSLAHGSVFTTGNPIEALIFVSERRQGQEVVGHQYVRCSPADFAKLLDRWFDFLQTNQISQADVAQSLSSAA